MSIIFFCLGIQYLGIDIGSEYIKAAESTVLGEPKMRFNPNGQNYRAAAAVRKQKFVEEYKTNEDLTAAELRFGNAALKTLKAHPESGFEYLSRAFGRVNTSFHTSTLFSTQEMMSLFLQDLGNTLTIDPDVIMAVPSYWTQSMRNELNFACENAGIKLVNIMDDKDAVAAHYAAINFNKYVNTSKNVLFVDIGSTSVKAYGYIFLSDGTNSFANETGTAWSEQTGSYFFAKSIAEAKKLSMKKAFKFFAEKSPSQYFSNISEPVHEMISVVQSASDSMKSFLKNVRLPGNSQQIDEVQVFGGSSRLSLFNKLIAKASGCQNVLHEFNPNEAIAKGIIYLRQMIDGSSTVPACRINNLPTQSIYVEAGGKMGQYCQNGAVCSSPIRLYNVTTDTEYVRVFINDDEIPEGTGKVQFIARLTNYTNITDVTDKTYLEVFFRPPSVEIQGIRFCYNSSKCIALSGETLSVPHIEAAKSANFTLAYLDAKKNVKAQRLEMQRVEQMINNIYGKVLKGLEKKGLTEESIPVETISTLKRYMKMVEDGTINNMSIDQLKDAQTDLKINSKYLLEAVEKLKGNKKAKEEQTKKETDDIFNDLKNEFEDDKKEEENKEL